MNKETRWLLDEKYQGVETPEFHADIVRLEAGEPLAYVIGWADFLGCRIDLSGRPLIPRPETEFWVERAITEIRAARGDHPLRILDLFSGSGCIGIALAKHLPNAEVHFGENDPALCRQIEKNIALNNIDASRTRVIKTDVFSSITDAYDYIFANPPYIDAANKETADNSVVAYEPHEALFADKGGLAFIFKLLNEGRAHLRSTGVMYIEFGADQKEAIARAANKAGWESESQKDQFDHWRLVRVSHR